MRISSARCAGMFWPSFVIAGAVVLMSAPTTTGYTVYDREYFLAPDALQFVRTGPNISIQSVRIGYDQHRFPNQGCSPAGSAPQPLDITGVNTPGPIAVRFLIPNIPSVQQN